MRLQKLLSPFVFVTITAVHSVALAKAPPAQSVRFDLTHVKMFTNADIVDTQVNATGTEMLVSCKRDTMGVANITFVNKDDTTSTHPIVCSRNGISSDDSIVGYVPKPTAASLAASSLGVHVVVFDAASTAARASRTNAH